MKNVEQQLAEELAQHMSVGMGAEDVMTFLSQTGQREGWMWQTLVSLRSQLAACQRENERLKTDAQFAGMAVERAESAEQQLADCQRERELDNKMLRFYRSECVRLGLTARVDMEGWPISLTNEPAESLQQQLAQMREALSGLLEQIENTPLRYYGDHTGHEAQFGTDQLERLRHMVLKGE